MYTSYNITFRQRLDRFTSAHQEIKVSCNSNRAAQFQRTITASRAKYRRLTDLMLDRCTQDCSFRCFQIDYCNAALTMYCRPCALQLYIADDEWRGLYTVNRVAQLIPCTSEGHFSRSYKYALVDLQICRFCKSTHKKSSEVWMHASRRTGSKFNLPVVG